MKILIASCAKLFGLRNI